MLSRLITTLNIVRLSFSFLSPYNNDEGIKSKNGILILTEDNFHKAVSDYHLLVVKFYAPWCGHCRTFEPEYLKLKKLLDYQNSDIVLAQVDGNEERNLVFEQKVRGFPALKLFIKGNSVIYNGPRKAEDIAYWLNQNCPTCK